MKTNEIIDKGERSVRLDLFSPCEKAIYNAQQELEKVGADIKLTEASTLLSKARQIVSDYLYQQENKRIIELVENCKLIKERAVENGHDCWGKLEWTTDLYAYVNGKSERVFEGMFVIHDGKTIESVVYDWQLKDYQNKQ